MFGGVKAGAGGAGKLRRCPRQTACTGELKTLKKKFLWHNEDQTMAGPGDPNTIVGVITIEGMKVGKAGGTGGGMRRKMKTTIVVAVGPDLVEEVLAQ